MYLRMNLHVRTVHLLFPSESELDHLVPEAAGQALCGPEQRRPAAGHVREDGGRLQAMEKPPGLLWAEGFGRGGGGHDLQRT